MDEAARSHVQLVIGRVPKITRVVTIFGKLTGFATFIVPDIGDGI